MAPTVNFRLKSVIIDVRLESGKTVGTGVEKMRLEKVAKPEDCEQDRVESVVA